MATAGDKVRARVVFKPMRDNTFEVGDKVRAVLRRNGTFSSLPLKSKSHLSIADALYGGSSLAHARPLCGGRHGIPSYTAFDICGRCIEAAKKKGLI